MYFMYFSGLTVGSTVGLMVGFTLGSRQKKNRNDK